MTMTTYVRCISVGDDPISLTSGEVYEALPVSSAEWRDGWLRVIDNEGQPYLHSAHLFEPVDPTTLMGGPAQIITVHLNGLTKLKLRDQAHANGMSMSAFLRALVEERLDLPATI
jgi:hypothetical protein